MKPPYYLIVDLEMGEVSLPDRERLSGMAKEIIQIGAVLLGPEMTAEGEFSAFCRPKIGFVSPYVRRMTGITNEALKNAPRLKQALSDMSEWLGDRRIIALSWSDADCRQLRQEMKVKHIDLPRIVALFPNWVDFQLSFGRLGGFHERCALSDALSIAHLTPTGKEHDALSDARNTARLFARLMKHPDVALALSPLNKPPEEPAQKKERWTLGKLFFALRHGKKAALGDNYRKYRLKRRLR